METDTQTSANLLKLIDEMSLFVQSYLKNGEKVLISCDSDPIFLSIRESLEKITLEDIGITSKTIKFFFQPQKICGIKVLEEPNASISVFCLSKDMYSFDFPPFFL